MATHVIGYPLLRMALFRDMLSPWYKQLQDELGDSDDSREDKGGYLVVRDEESSDLPHGVKRRGQDIHEGDVLESPAEPISAGKTADAVSTPTLQVIPTAEAPGDDDLSPSGAARRDLHRDYLMMRRRYKEHLKLVTSDPYLTYLEMMWLEFIDQEPTREDEFGPDEDLRSIYSSCMELPCTKEEQMKEWLLWANHLEDVQRLKRRRTEL